MSAFKSPFALWASTLAIGAYIGGQLPPFLVLRKTAEPSLPDAHADPVGTRAYRKLIETEMANLSIVRKLENTPGFVKTRAWEGVHYNDPKQQSAVFTAHTLRVPGGISVRPLVFTNKETSETVSIFHLGHRVTGFPFIIHGGVLATLLDESLARSAFLLFSDGAMGVTANLNINYKAPSLAHQFLVVKTEVTEHTDRKARVKGTVETARGKVLVEAEGLFVVPKAYALKTLEGF